MVNKETTNKTKFYCEECDRYFKTAGGYKMHIQSVHINGNNNNQNKNKDEKNTNDISPTVNVDINGSSSDINNNTTPANVLDSYNRTKDDNTFSSAIDKEKDENILKNTMDKMQKKLIKDKEKIDILQEEIKRFLSSLKKHTITQEQKAVLGKLFTKIAKRPPLCLSCPNDIAFMIQVLKENV